MLNRRQFLKVGGTAVAGAAAVGLYAWQVEPHWVELVRRDMAVEHLPQALDGKTLLHVSDIHVGTRVSSAYLIGAFQQAKDLAPDFVMISGDFISYRSANEFRELANVLRYLPNGRL